MLNPMDMPWGIQLGALTMGYGIALGLVFSLVADVLPKNSSVKGIMFALWL